MNASEIIERTRKMNSLIGIIFLTPFHIFLLPGYAFLLQSVFKVTVDNRMFSIMLVIAVCFHVILIHLINRKVGKIGAEIESCCSEKMLDQIEVEMNRNIEIDKYDAKLLYYTRQHLRKGNIDRAKELFVRLLGNL